MRLRGHRSLVPCELMFGPLPRRWSRRIATTASADFRSAPTMLTHTWPGLSGKPYSPVRQSDLPDKGIQNEPPLRFVSKQRVVSLPKLSIYLPTVISSSVSRCHARSPGIAGLMKFLLVVWQVLARMWLTTSSNNRFCKEVGVCQLNDTFAGFLPTGCYRTAVAFASYSI